MECDTQRKKYIRFNIFVVSFFYLFSLSSISYASHYKESFSKQVFDVFGKEEVSENINQQVKSITKTIGIKNIPIVRKLSEAIYLSQGAVPFVLFDHLYIYEPFFNILEQNEQDFIIAHELMHIEKKHSHSKVPLKLLSIALCGIGTLVPWLVFNKLSKEVTRIDKAISCAVSGGITWSCCQLGNLFFSRSCEREADKEAAIRLGTAQGGINFFKRMQEHLGELAFKPNIIKKITDSILLSTHPSFQERIDYLEALNL